MNLESTTGISVHGQGRMDAEPDIAELQLAVSRLAEAPAGAFEATRAAVGAVRASLESSGIPEAAIRVSRLRLSAVYDYTNNRQRLTGHEASADITVAIKDVNATDTIITATIDAGANAVQSLIFDTTRRTEFEESAQRAAVADARRKASVFADAAGVTIGDVVHLEESGGNGPTPLAGNMLMAESADPAFVSGSISIEASVMVRFSISEPTPHET